MEIYVGSTAPVKHKIYWRGEELDSDNPPVVSIYDITNDPINPVSPTTVLATFSSEKLETEVGIYQIFIPTTLMTRERTLRIVWSYTISGLEQTKQHDIYVVKPYTDLEQVREELDFGGERSDPNYKSYQQLVVAERYARRVIETHTGQRFYLYDETHLAHGTGSDTLMLSAKIVQLHKLYVNDSLLINELSSPKVNNLSSTIDITESGFGLRINRASAMDNTVYTANGLVPPSIHENGSAFKQGNRYQVFGRFGYADVPDDIDLACVELMKDYFSKDAAWRNKYINKISTFDWDFEYGPGATYGTGNLYVDQLLSDYVVSKVMLL